MRIYVNCARGGGEPGNEDREKYNTLSSSADSTEKCSFQLQWNLSSDVSARCSVIIAINILTLTIDHL